jgi:sugar-phosphatase
VKIATQGLLFDMDGVLISSIGSVVRSWRIWTKMYGIAGWESYEVPHGMRAIDIVRELRPDLDEASVLAGLRVIEDIEMDDTEDLMVLPGARELLESLPPERWSIVTSATRRLLLGRLAAAGLPIPARVIAADDVVNGKPHPEPYMTGAKLLGFDPSECIVFEDAPAGVGAGVAAGSRVVGVLGTHTAEELSAATWIVPSLAGVVARSTAEGLEVEFSAV